jgi:hypothetical protein
LRAFFKRTNVPVFTGWSELCINLLICTDLQYCVECLEKFAHFFTRKNSLLQELSVDELSDTRISDISECWYSYKMHCNSWYGLQITKYTQGHKFIQFINFNSQFLYSLTICMLHYNPRHVSSINMTIFRRTNCIITASGIVTVCTVQCSMPDESRLQSLLSSGIPYIRLQRVTIWDAVIIQFVLLKMGMLML